MIETSFCFLGARTMPRKVNYGVDYDDDYDDVDEYDYGYEVEENGEWIFFSIFLLCLRFAMIY